MLYECGQKRKRLLAEAQPTGLECAGRILNRCRSRVKCIGWQATRSRHLEFSLRGAAHDFDALAGIDLSVNTCVQIEIQ
jgi:hypothetical protein